MKRLSVGLILITLLTSLTWASVEVDKMYMKIMGDVAVQNYEQVRPTGLSKWQWEAFLADSADHMRPTFITDFTEELTRFGAEQGIEVAHVEVMSILGWLGRARPTFKVRPAPNDETTSQRFANALTKALQDNTFPVETFPLMGRASWDDKVTVKGKT